MRGIFVIPIGKRADVRTMPVTYATIIVLGLVAAFWSAAHFR